MTAKAFLALTLLIPALLLAGSPQALEQLEQVAERLAPAKPEPKDWREKSLEAQKDNWRKKEADKVSVRVRGGVATTEKLAAEVEGSMWLRGTPQDLSTEDLEGLRIVELLADDATARTASGSVRLLTTSAAEARLVERLEALSTEERTTLTEEVQRDRDLLVQRGVDVDRLLETIAAVEQDLAAAAEAAAAETSAPDSE